MLKHLPDRYEANGVRNLHGLQGDTSVGSIVNAHVSAGLTNTSFYNPSETCLFLLQGDDFLEETIIVKDGCIRLSDKPSLGIKVDKKKFRKFALKFRGGRCGRWNHT